MEEVPFEDRYVPRAEIDWARSAWWWSPLTRAIHPSIKMTTLVLSLVALWLVRLGFLLGVMLFQPQRNDSTDWTYSWEAFSGQEFPSQFFYSPIVKGIGDLSQALITLKPGLNELAFISFLGLWMAFALSLLGGFLARRAMVELGQQTIAPWGETLTIVGSRWLSFLWAIGMHFVGLLALLVPIALLGLIARLGSIGANTAGVLLIICFPLVFALGRLLMSLTFCYPLSVCAIAAEKKADAFEGFSRSNAYLFQRPVVTVLCLLLLSIIGLVGEQLVMWTLYLGWGLVRGVYLYCGGGIQPASNPFISLGNNLTNELVYAFWFSYFWSAMGATYLILRKSVDNTELDEMDSIENPVETTLPEIPKTPPATNAPQEQETPSE